jgi:hypothetical protein
MLWAETDGDAPLVENYTADDIVPEAMARIIDDCKAFQEENATRLAAYPTGGIYSREELAGHDLWLTRNEHGVGFWDREYLPQWARDALTESANRLGPVWVYVGDDGRLYL